MTTGRRRGPGRPGRVELAERRATAEARVASWAREQAEAGRAIYAVGPDGRPVRLDEVLVEALAGRPVSARGRRLVAARRDPAEAVARCRSGAAAVARDLATPGRLSRAVAFVKVDAMTRLLPPDRADPLVADLRGALSQARAALVAGDEDAASSYLSGAAREATRPRGTVATWLAVRRASAAIAAGRVDEASRRLAAVGEAPEGDWRLGDAIHAAARSLVATPGNLRGAGINVERALSMM